ncbi:MAG: Rieske (2Fe-2S) protein [Candidatus Nanopelagicales bacterium]
MQNRRSFLAMGLGAFASLPLLKALPFGLSAKRYSVGKLTDIPVKGGKVFTVGGKRVLVTRPEKKLVRAFLAACTHEGQSLNGASNNQIVCSRHGARFDTTMGRAIQGPASRSLVKVEVKLTKKNRIILNIN